MGEIMVQPTQNDVTSISAGPAHQLITQADANETAANIIGEFVKLLFTSIGSALWFVPSLVIRALSDWTSSSIPVNEKTGAPVALHDLLKIVEEKAKTTQGIYRKSASATDLNELTKKISEGNSEGVSGTMDPHLAACSVKKMLRDMPGEEKVFPAEVPNLEELESSDKLKAVKTTISALSSQKKAFLTRLVDHVEAVSLFSDVNKMPKSNLAIVLAPNLFAQHSDLSKEFAAMGIRNAFFTFVVDNRSALDI